MIRLFTIATFLGLIFIPDTLLSDEFKLLECNYTYFTHLHSAKDLPIVSSYKQRGIIRSKSKNNFLDHATYYLEGVLKRPPTDGNYLTFQEGDGKYAVVIVDKDGDAILGHVSGDITTYYLESGSSLSGEFTDGTGRYKGISGKFEFSRFSGDTDKIKADLKKHLDEMPPLGSGSANSHEMCNVVAGSFAIQK